MKDRRVSVIVMAAFGLALLWAYWPTLRGLAWRWESDARYAHGYLVPAFAAGMLWMRRDHLGATSWRACSGAWGVALITLGIGLRAVGTGLYFEWVEAISLLPALAGACALAGGRPLLRWAWPAITFLAFAIPLPYTLESSLGGPLQRFATKVSTITLQTMGLPAMAEGNVITIDGWRIGVVEACNGMGIMLLFFTFSTGAAMLVRRPALDRALIVASAVPIALVSNVARIALTGALHELFGSRVADFVYHDLAGWLMMPMAMALLWAELQLLSILLVPVDSPEAPQEAGPPVAHVEAAHSPERAPAAPAGT